ncbi:type II toxin-antitoxin system VapC family toxin [Chitinophagaceae bacterium LWZ2-11]
MANKIVLADTSILIDLFRRTDKNNAALVSLVRQGYSYCISSITEYEIYTGASLGQLDFWNDFLKETEVFSFDKVAAQIAVELNRDLKKKRKQIAIPDLFIASIAISNNLLFATLNRKHFDRIDKLNIVE